MAQLIKAPARRAGDPGSNPDPSENFSLEIINKYFHFFKLNLRLRPLKRSSDIMKLLKKAITDNMFW